MVLIANFWAVYNIIIFEHCHGAHQDGELGTIYGDYGP